MTAPQIPFTRGVPSLDLLPVEDLRAAADRALRDHPESLLYGPGAGNASLRSWIGEREDVSPDRVVATNGSLQAFAFLCEVLLAKAATKRVLIEAPCYDRSIIILRERGADVHGVALDADGLDPDAVEADVRANGAPAFLYTIPTFQNPSGATLGAARRQRLIELATEHDFLLMEDDPYGLLRWAGDPAPTLLSLGGERVVRMSSFTKTVAPGLRAGYAVCPPTLARTLANHATNASIAPGGLAHATLASYLEEDRFDDNLKRARAGLRERCAAMADAVSEQFPAGTRFVTPEGGYFLWVETPGVDTTELAPLAADAGVPYVKGEDFYPVDGDGREALRLAFSAVPPDQIGEGITRLAGVVAGALARA